MENSSSFWQLWAPHLTYLEDNHLDLKTINTLANKISGPVLVVGGGQGLLVNELQKQGLQVDGVDSSDEMVKLAEQRRGVKLIKTNGSTLPFKDGTYKTTIIATGVVDFIKDQDQIRQIIEETKRVTANDGKLLISFYSLHPESERFLRKIGIITEDGDVQRKKLFSLSRLEPKEFFATIRKTGNLSQFGAFLSVLRMQLLSSKMDRLLSKNLKMILKNAPNANELIESVDEIIPFHNEKTIRGLFRKLALPINKLENYETCYVVDINAGS